ncbi:hypothetical protein RYH80_17935 [Halobaculum sp. MBLA0147]|uniref:hypothetical protein n=1 Tax=Halobaculum sp. MBLA0147 TaxID=3079934 RepID=UPI003523264E
MGDDKSTDPDRDESTSSADTRPPSDHPDVPDSRSPDIPPLSGDDLETTDATPPDSISTPDGLLHHTLHSRISSEGATAMIRWLHSERSTLPEPVFSYTVETVDTGTVAYDNATFIVGTESADGVFFGVKTPNQKAGAIIEPDTAHAIFTHLLDTESAAVMSTNEWLADRLE